MSRHTSTTYRTARRNIKAISQLEQQALKRRTLAERISDRINHYAGTMTFIVFHICWFGIWIVWNSAKALHLPVFDPYPYQLLTLVVSLEAIFLSLFILMSQNRMTRQSDERGHLDLQINLLNEFETTKMLQMLQSICEHLGLPEAHDRDVQDLKSRTSPEWLLHEIKQNIPESC